MHLPLTALYRSFYTQVQGLVDELCMTVAAWASASHLHWGVWGLAQRYTLSAMEFDYSLFARERLRQIECMASDLGGSL